MKLHGTHTFKANSTLVFQALLNPEVLKASIPNCEAVSYVDANTLRLDVSSPLPGLKGTISANLKITRAQAPSFLELQLIRQGRGGSVNATAQISLADEANGTLLTYNANADLEGPAAVANNLLGESMVKSQLNGFFKNLEKSIG
ncbi:MAG TPA: SRPBCC domain-containing protein [Ktedonobacteraceae bacterium]|nr:SRPBCC domain-containing protein [Ktedonobacteraceae bacterium]